MIKTNHLLVTVKLIIEGARTEPGFPDAGSGRGSLHQSTDFAAS